MNNAVWVGIGGFIGAVTRYWLAPRITAWVIQAAGWSLPLGTAFVNITGSFLLGVFLVWSRETLPDNSPIIPLVATGFFGAYTTYSTFANETMTLVRQGDWGAASLYIALTTGLCLLGAMAGFWVGTLITR